MTDPEVAAARSEPVVTLADVGRDGESAGVANGIPARRLHPAWIVIVAHSSNLQTWYAHMQPRYPVRAGQVVKKGQVIGYEGNTGRSTGAHLHWMVEYNGSFVNPRLFT